MISAVIVTFNEAEKLKKCLSSIVNFATEIVVVDLGSTDTTKEVADAFSCRFVSHKFVPYVEQVRNFAIDQCNGDWILVLDPDELMPKSLKQYLLKYIQGTHVGVLNIPRRNIFFGRWIRYTNFWPDYQIRFFSKGTVKWQKVLHSYPKTTIPALKLPKDKKYAIKHLTYPTFSSFIEKQKRYAAIRAKERYAAGERASFFVLGYLLSREVLSRYVKHKGFLDKKRGLFLLVGLLFYFCAVEWKLKQMENLHKTISTS